MSMKQSLFLFGVIVLCALALAASTPGSQEQLCDKFIYEVEHDGGTELFLEYDDAMEAVQGAIRSHYDDEEARHKQCDEVRFATTVMVRSRIGSPQELLDLGWCDYDPCEHKGCEVECDKSVEWCSRNPKKCRG